MIFLVFRSFSKISSIWHTIGKVYIYGKTYQENVINTIKKEYDTLLSVKNRNRFYEKNGVGAYLGNVLYNEYNLIFSPHTNTIKKHFRITMWEGYIKDGTIILLNDNTKSNKEFIQQVKDYELNVNHDDAPDSMAGLLYKIRN